MSGLVELVWNTSLTFQQALLIIRFCLHGETHLGRLRLFQPLRLISHDCLYIVEPPNEPITLTAENSFLSHFTPFSYIFYVDKYLSLIIILHFAVLSKLVSSTVINLCATRKVEEWINRNGTRKARVLNNRTSSLRKSFRTLHKRSAMRSVLLCELHTRVRYSQSSWSRRHQFGVHSA